MALIAIVLIIWQAILTAGLIFLYRRGEATRQAAARKTINFP